MAAFLWCLRDANGSSTQQQLCLWLCGWIVWGAWVSGGFSFILLDKAAKRAGGHIFCWSYRMCV